MTENLKPLRQHLNETLATLGAMHTISHLGAQTDPALPGSTVLADYKTVLEHLELEAIQAIGQVAAELRKPTVGDLVDRLWEEGPQSFKQIQAAVIADAPAGQIETLLNRLRNAGLLDASAQPEPASALSVELGNAVTLPPTRLPLPDEAPVRAGEVTQALPASVPGAEFPGVANLPSGDVTSTFSKLVTGKGRAWFNERAIANGIDLGERINCQF